MLQQSLNVTPVRMQEIENISMGVLPNGETFLSLQGLARFCGVAPSSIIQLSQDWKNGEAQGKIRGKQLLQLIKEWTDSNEPPLSLYVEIDSKSSISGVIHAVPESIVMAVTDYYAHYSQSPKQEAINNYRKAARLGIRKYIYDRLNYSEQDLIQQSWQLFQERILSNETPQGYFTMFDEATTIIASMIRNNIAVDDSIMPDGSLGNVWARYWKAQGLAIQFGERIKIIHRFPESYRQLDPEINAYPNAALSSFRTWFQDVYLVEKYPNYLNRKVGAGGITTESIPMLLAAVLPPTLPNNPRLN